MCTPASQKQEQEESRDRRPQMNLLSFEREGEGTE
jgi:hypothetical protein